MSKIIIMNSAVIPQNQDGIYCYKTLTKEDFVTEINQATDWDYGRLEKKEI